MTRTRWVVTIAAALIFSREGLATTKGLSQIVTPDIQSEGDLSLSFQLMDSAIGNPYQIQEELGVLRWLEVAAFEGLKPGEGIFGAQVGLVQNEPYLLSTGFINFSTIDGHAEPFLEAGYYTKDAKWIAGGIVISSNVRALFGFAYDFGPHWQAQVDFETGDENFSTVGFTYSLNDRFQFNPALYISNASGHDLLGYIVFTYTVPVWKGSGAEDARP